MTRGNKKKGTMLFGKQEERNKMTTRRKAHASNHPVPNSSLSSPPIPSTPLNTNPKLHADTHKTSNLSPKRLKMRAQNLTKGKSF